MIVFLFCFISSIVTPGNVSDELFPVIMRQLFAQYNGTYASGASVKISKDGEKIYEESIGYDNYDTKNPASSDTMYEWGSITKVFTHVAMMQLKEAGKVNFEDDIEVYIGKNFFKHRMYKEKITILNLMNHDAGWDETIESPLIPGNKMNIELQEILKAMEPRMYSPPGDKIGYSNYGVALEGLIIEKVTGQNYITYIRNNIIDRLGMNRTSIDPGRNDIEGDLLEKKAKGYEVVENRLYEMDDYTVQLFPAGSLLGPIGDLALFANALTPIPGKQCPLFQKNETLSEFLSLTRKVADGAPGIAHGLWEQFYTNKIRAVEHSGNTAGHTAIMSIIPELGWNFVGLANTYGDFLFCQVFHRYIWGTYTPVNSTKIPKDVVGTYQSNRIVHNGYLSHVHLLQTSEVTLDETTNQFLFDGIAFNRSDLNLYTRAGMTKNAPMGTYHFSFIFNDKNEVTGLYTLGLAYRKLKPNENKMLKLYIHIIDICFFAAIGPLAMALIAAFIHNKRVFLSRHLKYIVITLVLCGECVAEPLLLKSSKSIRTYIKLQHNLKFIVMSLYIIISVRALCSLLTIIFLVYDFIIHRKHTKLESMTVFESLNNYIDEADFGRAPKKTVPKKLTAFLVYTALFLANCLSGTLIYCGYMIDIYRL